MSNLTEVESSQPRRKSLWPVYHLASAYEYTDPAHARRVLDALQAEGLDNYTAPPDLWHNLSMVAARVLHQEMELALVQAGLREWPDNVDLLCDELQLRHTSHYDPVRAKAIWEKLYTMERSKTSPYWRFWVYGAIYHAIELDDRKTALELLNEGLCSVRRDAVMDILRSYRRVLMDSAPESKPESIEKVKEYQQQVLNALEGYYKLGIELGVENAYVLATDLAKLYQERAAQPYIPSHGAMAEDSSAKPDRKDYLEEAWRYLDLAEKLYTGSPNHPIWDIYEVRARILMAQRRYGESLKFLSSLPQARFNSNPSLSAMLKLASMMTGEKPAELVNISSQEGIDQMLQKLFENDGALLISAARQSPQVRILLRRITEQLGENVEQTQEIPLERALETVIPYLFGDNGEGLLNLAQQNPTVRTILLRINEQLK